MAKIAVLLPKEFMKEQAERVIEKNNYNIHSVKVIKSVDAIAEARNAVNTGADIIVSRGYQAKLIQENTNIPVAEMKVSVQDLGLIVKKVRSLSDKDVPKIAIVAFKNMIEDTSYFKELFNVDIIEYFIDDFDEVDYVIQAIKEADVDVVLGGEIIEQTVAKYDIPALFIESTENSIENALRLADRMCYAIDIEQSNKAYVNTVMETAFNGIIKIDENKKIIAINHAIDEILKSKNSDVIGLSIEEVIPEINIGFVDDILVGRKESYSTSIRINNVPVMLIMAPIQVENEIHGAIISTRRLEMERSSDDNIKDMIMNGFTAKYNFSHITTSDSKYMYNIELAKKYALIKSPVFILCEDYLACEKIAQSIHNNSNRKSAPYLSINCSGLNSKEQQVMLFGNEEYDGDAIIKKGSIESANLGTIHIEEIEKLSINCQYKLFKVINNLPIFKPDVGMRKKYDIKIILSSKVELWPLVEKGLFREDLYYSICPFIVKIPPLRKRVEDIEKIIDTRLKSFISKYSTYITISPEAKKVLLSYNWSGNEMQLNFFCDRLFLTTDKKVIDEAYVVNLLEELYPSVDNIDGNDRIVVYKHPEALNIIKLLDEHNGNRADVAKELSISTTTLWRKMKKYGILSKYNN